MCECTRNKMIFLVSIRNKSFCTLGQFSCKSKQKEEKFEKDCPKPNALYTAIFQD